MYPDKNETIVVAMSGGVDSSAAAAILVEQGYKVIGVTMKLWDYEEVVGNVNHESGCCSISNINDARIVCNNLKIPHHVVNLSKPFFELVVNNFVDEYLHGRTPNPCVLCNTKIKWENLLEKIEEFGARYVATGHYAKVFGDPHTGRYRLFKGKDDNKDQSYALWGVKQDSLAHTLFPLSDLTKPEARKIAERFGLRIARKSESQEICFVPDNDYRGFLLRSSHVDKHRIRKGKLVSTDGTVLGEHYGYPFYTIGQRRGVGKGLKKGFGKKLYVVDIIPSGNLVVLGEESELFSRGLKASGINMIGTENIDPDKWYNVKIRYNDTGKPAKIEKTGNDKLRIIFKEPRKAVTPGQSVVFYDGDEVIGGAFIEEAIKNV
jgi:tRNA-specific 2-thiouridylase